MGLLAAVHVSYIQLYRGRVQHHFYGCGHFAHRKILGEHRQFYEIGPAVWLLPVPRHPAYGRLFTGERAGKGASGADGDEL